MNGSVTDCSFCSSSQIFTEWATGIVRCGQCKSVLELRQSQYRAVATDIVSTTPLWVESTDLPAVSSQESSATGFITSFSLMDLSQELLYVATSRSQPGNALELLRAVEVAQEQANSTDQYAGTAAAGAAAAAPPLYTEDRGLVVAYLQMVDICEQLQLPHSLVSAGMKVFGEYCRNNDARRAVPEVLLRLVSAVREVGKPVSMAEIAAAAKLQTKDVGKYTRAMGSVPPDSSSAIYEYMKRYCKEMGLPENVALLALEMAQRVSQTDLTKRNPRTLCAAIIYLACQFEDVRRTQAEVSRVANVTEVTLRKVYKDLTAALKDVLPANYQPRIPIDAVLGRHKMSGGSNTSTPVQPLSLPAQQQPSPHQQQQYGMQRPVGVGMGVGIGGGLGRGAPSGPVRVLPGTTVVVGASHPHSSPPVRAGVVAASTTATAVATTAATVAAAAAAATHVSAAADVSAAGAGVNGGGSAGGMLAGPAAAAAAPTTTSVAAGAIASTAAAAASTVPSDAATTTPNAAALTSEQAVTGAATTADEGLRTQSSATGAAAAPSQ